ncbi:non-specific lipid transfer protein GPI-anchored 15 isoform X2 [Quercus suber]|uniref:non-specific lipid transfer protein GPI-anchored 15 isoform X2 n=1 Tax=Quercus suber TaxID=58331 RepID=UPI000CE22E3F|nr:non-specific lipid-transfer protein-like protein At2g13820 [Quercus suber]
MAFKGTEKGLVLVLVAMLWSGAMAQSGCTSVLPNLAPCLNYITGNSSTPSSSCCSQPSNVVQSSPQCLCTALNGGAASLGININKTRALSLPSACNVQTPPISQCKVSSTGANGTPPVGSPADSSDEAPAGATTTSASGIPSGAGSKTTPSINGGSSDGNTIKAPLHFMVFLLFIVSCASTVTMF